MSTPYILIAETCIYFFTLCLFNLRTQIKTESEKSCTQAIVPHVNFPMKFTKISHKPLREYHVKLFERVFSRDTQLAL